MKRLQHMNSSVLRKSARVLTVLLILSLTLAAGCSKPEQPAQPTPAPAEQQPQAQPEPQQPQEMKTLKVALLAPVTGGVAASGQEMVNGWSLWWELHGNVVGNVRIQTRHYDTASDPNTALTRAREAVERDGANLIIGGLLASEGLAIAPYAESKQIPYFTVIPSADDLSQRKSSEWVLKVAGWSSSQIHHPAGEWAFKQGYKTAVTLASNYAFGHEVSGGFSRTYVESGGQVLEHIFYPFGTTDFSPFLGRIDNLKPDVVFVLGVGGEVVPFYTQWEDFGLKDKQMLIAGETSTDQTTTRKLPPESILGVMSFAHYAEGRDDPMTREFVTAFGEKHGQIPGYYGAALYVAGQWLSQAVETVTEPTDSKALLAAVKAVELENSAMGPMKLDAYNGNVQNIYLRKMVPTPPEYQKWGKFWNEVVEVIPNVSQFWKYDPVEFMKNPVYSESYQGH